MKLFALLTSVSVLAATHATAETVQLTLTYNNITEVFYPDADFMSGDGYAYDPTNPLNDPTDLQYDANYSSRQAEAREDMLQQIFGDGRQNGGATFVSGDNRWDYTPVTPYSIELTLVVDKSLFDLTTNFFTTANGPGNASGFNALGQLNTPISYEKLANGTTVDSATLFNSTLYGARRGLDVGNGDTADALAIGFGEEYTVSETAFAEADSAGIEILFGLLPSGGDTTSPWFDDAVTAGASNALDYALNGAGFTQIFQYDETWRGTDGDNIRNLELGRFEVEGELQSFSGSPISTPAPVPLPLPALMLLSGIAGVGLLRRRKAAV